MSKELPFFKFDPTEWLIGRISFQPIDVQGAFTQACCMYWKLGGKMKDTDIDFRIGKEYLQKLKDLNFIKEEGEFLRIIFLDNQLSECQEIRDKMRLIGQLGGKSSARLRSVEHTASESQTKANQTLSDHQLSKSKRESKSKNKERKIKKEFIPPSVEDVKNYFKENGYKVSVAERAFKGYSENNWHDAHDNKISNWKSKMVNSWFKEENKETGSAPVQKAVYTPPKKVANGPQY